MLDFSRGDQIVLKHVMCKLVLWHIILVGRANVLNRVQKTAGAITRRRGLPPNAKPLRAKIGNNP